MPIVVDRHEQMACVLARDGSRGGDTMAILQRDDRFMMTTYIRCILALLLITLFTPVLAQEDTTAEVETKDHVLLSTSMGNIVIRLFPEQAPVTTRNVTQYVEDGFYDGTIFHRVIDNFMIQGGGFTEDFTRKPTRDPIINESTNRLPNKRGTVAMARTSIRNSATSQFYINVRDNASLDYMGEMNSRTWGYAVFGEVVQGMDVVDRIRSVPTGPVSPQHPAAPLEPIVINQATLVSGPLPEPAEAIDATEAPPADADG